MNWSPSQPSGMLQLMLPMHFSQSLWQQSAGHSLFSCEGLSNTPGTDSQGWKHSPTVCHGLLQTALEQGDSPEPLQYIDDIIDTDAEEGLRPLLLQILVKGFLV